MKFSENNKAIFLQIADNICDEVAKGRYSPGDRVPSVREYAASVQVNANTVMRAYDLLSQKGIIVNKRGIGYFVADDACKIINSQLAQRFLDTELKYAFSRLEALGITPEALSTLYTEYLQQKQ